MWSIRRGEHTSLVLWTPHSMGRDTARIGLSLAARESRKVRSDTFSFLVEDRFCQLPRLIAWGIPES